MRFAELFKAVRIANAADYEVTDNYNHQSVEDQVVHDGEVGDLGLIQADQLGPKDVKGWENRTVDQDNQCYYEPT